MRRSLWLSLALFLASCNALTTMTPTPLIIVQTVVVERVVTPTSSPKVTDTPRLKSTDAPTPIQTKVWTDKTIIVETKNLSIAYPAFVEANDARKHGDTLQQAHAAYRELFALTTEDPFEGKKTTITFDPKVERSEATSAFEIRMGASSGILYGLTNPPSPIYYHEMVHTFEYAQWRTKRYYLSFIISGINEAFADYFAYYYGRELSKSPESLRMFDGWREKAADNLKEYETKRFDPYTLDWGQHPPPPSGEIYFLSMLFRVSDKCGWGVWQKFYASNEGRLKTLPESKVIEMRDPVYQKAFADFVAGLSKACGQELAPMFRAWRFDL